MKVFRAAIVSKGYGHRSTTRILHWRMGRAKIISGNGVAHAASGSGRLRVWSTEQFGHQFDRFLESPALCRTEHLTGKASNRGRYLCTPTPTERQLHPISQYESGLSDQGGPDLACMREIHKRRPMNANKL